MASIYLDRQANAWKFKSVDGGKDRRTTIRKAFPGEPRSPIPDDVVIEARRRGFGFAFRSETPDIPAPPPESAVPDDLGSFVDYFLDDYRLTHRPGSVQRMDGILRRFRLYLSTPGAPDRVSRVREAHILAWFEWRRKQIDPRLQIAIKPHVVVGETELLSGMFRSAVDAGLLPSNPCKRPLDKLRKAYPKPDPADATKYLDSHVDLPQFLASLESSVKSGRIPQDYSDLALVMLATGLRVEAALNLDYGWVGKDWIVKVPAEFDKCKTGYSTVVAEFGRPILKRRRGLQVQGRVFDPYMTQDMAYHHLRKLGINNHTLRHSFATWLVDAGVPVQTIGALLGHKHISTTQRYAKVRDAAKVQAVAKLKFGVV